MIRKSSMKHKFKKESMASQEIDSSCKIERRVPYSSRKLSVKKKESVSISDVMASNSTDEADSESDQELPSAEVRMKFENDYLEYLLQYRKEVFEKAMEKYEKVEDNSQIVDMTTLQVEKDGIWEDLEEKHLNPMGYTISDRSVQYLKITRKWAKLEKLQKKKLRESSKRKELALNESRFSSNKGKKEELKNFSLKDEKNDEHPTKNQKKIISTTNETPSIKRKDYRRRINSLISIDPDLSKLPLDDICLITTPRKHTTLKHSSPFKHTTPNCCSKAKYLPKVPVDCLSSLFD